MADPLHQAIDNNVGLYRAIFGGLGIGLDVAPEIAWTAERAPPFYSNAVTRLRRWRPDDTFERIAWAAETEGWGGWSIKDSHDVLDLAPRGFGRLFRANWVHLDPPRLARIPHRLRVEAVRDEEGLTRWRQGWDPSLEPARTLFGPDLLRDLNLHFVLGYDGARLVCGCLFNWTGEVLGMSNFFAQGDERACWAALAGYALDQFKPSGLVGYAQDVVLTDFLAVGFEAVGPLSVWHRSTG